MLPVDERFKGIRKIGTKSKWTQDFYHSVLAASWPVFFLFYSLSFLFFNFVFAVLYYLIPGSVAGTDRSLWHLFCFSVQTFTTIGYGVFTPGSDAGHLLVLIESILSVFVTALLTGLIFSKFSRPSARIIFSKNVLINNYDGKRTLSLRMGNLRANQIVEAQVRVVILKSYKTIEGENSRRQIDLNLISNSSLFFALSWSVMHIIDESSPLYGLTAEDFKTQNIEIGVSVIGYDATFDQTIHANVMYEPSDVIFDRYFADLFTLSGNKVVSLNYDKFHDLKA
jgi:inward rectifier potassium channel